MAVAVVMVPMGVIVFAVVVVPVRVIVVPVAMLLPMTVMLSMAVPMASSPQVVGQEPASQPHDQQSGARAEPGKNLFGKDVVGCEEGYQAQQNDAGGVGRGDDPAEEQGVAHRTPGADEIGGDDGLAVPRLQPVSSA